MNQSVDFNLQECICCVNSFTRAYYSKNRTNNFRIVETDSFGFSTKFQKAHKTELNSAFTGIFFMKKYLNPGAYL